MSQVASQDSDPGTDDRAVDPRWYLATTLAERARLEPRAYCSDPERAARRMAQWQAQAPFDAGMSIEQRLAGAGCDAQGWQALLGEDPAGLQGRVAQSPFWLSHLIEVYARGSTDLPQAFRLDPASTPHAGFLSVLAPLLSDACGRLTARVRDIGEPYDAVLLDPDSAPEVLAGRLPGRLLLSISRTLTLELQIARLEGTLTGATSQERFADFCQRLMQPDFAVALLGRYPVLARRIVTHIEQWLASSCELVERLAADWETLRETLLSSDVPASLTRVDTGLGDPHEGGRTVARLHFDTGQRLIYKPRSLATDAAFSGLVDWLNERGDQPRLRTPRVIDRGDYGWAEHIEHKPCADEAEVERFYRRQGAYMALLYALEAIDCHHENLLAAGEHPVLVDFETLFHPPVDEVDAKEDERGADHTVLRLGLLPMSGGGEDDDSGVDISGMGMRGGQPSARATPAPEQPGTDAMRFAPKRLVMPDSHHRPTVEGAEVDLVAYSDAIQRGFDDMYRTLLAQRDVLRADNGPLSAFTGGEARVVVRATRVYTRLLETSFHPDYLSDALAADQLFDKLWLDAVERPELADVIESEHAALHQGDIPRFTATPDSRGLRCPDGRVLEDWLPESGMTAVKRRLASLSESDRQRQRWIIAASLRTLGDRGAQRVPPYYLKPGTEPVGRERLLRMADHAGRRLGTLSLQRGDQAYWLDLHAGTDGGARLAPVGLDLYAGLPGMGLFLATLGAVTHESGYVDLARATWRRLVQIVDATANHELAIGAFNGWAGLVYTGVRLGELWQSRELLDQAEHWAGRLATRIDEDAFLDVIGGAAGAAIALLALRAHRPSTALDAACRRCGDHLLDQARAQESGWGWVGNPDVFGPRPLLGFAHGAAGFAWALQRLASALDVHAYRDAADRALAYERSQYSPADGNWPDLRPQHDRGAQTAAAPRQLCAWCHGAAGVGLGRLAYMDALKEHAERPSCKRCEDELDVALATTRKRGFGQNHSLCHGDLGNLELLLKAADRRGDNALREEAGRLASGIVDDMQANGFRCGGTPGREIPGLMTGIAGIGYGLLRAAEPQRVPPVLLLETAPDGTA